MQIIKVENRILWNKKDSRLVTANGSDIIVEVVSRPVSGYGFIIASQNGSNASVRWDVESISGRRINPYSNNQVVYSGTGLRLITDAKNPRPQDWKVYLSAVRVGF